VTPQGPRIPNVGASTTPEGVVDDGFLAAFGTGMLEPPKAVAGGSRVAMPHAERIEAWDAKPRWNAHLRLVSKAVCAIDPDVLSKHLALLIQFHVFGQLQRKSD